MKQRIITGALLAIVLGLFVYFGEGEWEFLFSGLCVLLAGVAAYEFMKMTRTNQKIRLIDFLVIDLTVLFVLLNVLFFRKDWYYLAVFIFLIGLIFLYALIYIFVDSFKQSDLANQLLTIFYCSFGFVGFAYLRTVGIHLIIYLFIVTMLTDVFAYFIGVKFGKHRLAAKISPKKSIEGALAGLVIAGVLGSLYAYYLNVLEYDYVLVLLMSFGLSIVSQIGDLIASKFKREAGIKDYGNIFPGHGGVLDRFDSSMFAAMVLMFFVMVL